MKATIKASLPEKKSACPAEHVSAWPELVIHINDNAQCVRPQFHVAKHRDNDKHAFDTEEKH